MRLAPVTCAADREGSGSPIIATSSAQRRLAGASRYHPRTSHSVKLSGALVPDARIASEAAGRSIADQIEFGRGSGGQSSPCSGACR